jgi:pimeloyl-ACP methyl ester carboxylesterase
MSFVPSNRGELHTALVVTALAVLAVHLVASALFFMDANIAERLVWAGIVGLAFGATVYNFRSLPTPVRGSLCLGVGLAALIVGATIHVARIAQVGVSAGDPTGLAEFVAGLVLTLAGGTTIVRLVYTWWRRLLLVPVAAVAGFFVVLPVGVGVYATNVTHVPCCDVSPADHGFAYEDVSFEGPGGHRMSAWYIPSVNGEVVIMVHGAGTNRSSVLDEGIVFARHGYGVFLLDLEGFGDSEGRANAFGWTGARGVHAAVNYLRSRGDIQADGFAAYGRSMGGEVLLQAAGENPHLRAVISEGGTGRTAADFAEMDDGRFEFIVPFHWVVGGTMRLISGESAPPPLKQMVQQIAPRHVLLLAANLGEETDLMGQYLELGGPTFELWTIPEPKHVGAYDLHPEEFEQRAIAFFERALSDDAVGNAASAE